MPLTSKVSTPLTKRDVIEIDESRCDGCGLCVRGCAEGALEIVEGKARLVTEAYCDGLGACLAECPRGALRIVSRESEAFDEEAAMAALAARGAAGPSAPAAGRAGRAGASAPSHSGCPGARPVELAGRFGDPEPAPGGCPGARPRDLAREGGAGGGSEGARLVGWPIQLKLLPPGAGFLDAPALVLAADCTAFACPGFHGRFLGGGAPLAVGCPKLDDVDAYIIKLGEILKAHPAIREVRVAIMEVPCCRGMAYVAVRGVERSGREDVSLRVWVVGLDGTVREELPEGE
jgi:ferredoxin